MSKGTTTSDVSRRSSRKKIPKKSKRITKKSDKR